MLRLRYFILRVQMLMPREFSSEQQIYQLSYCIITYEAKKCNPECLSLVFADKVIVSLVFTISSLL